MDLLKPIPVQINPPGSCGFILPFALRKEHAKMLLEQKGRVFVITLVEYDEPSQNGSLRFEPSYPTKILIDEKKQKTINEKISADALQSAIKHSGMSVSGCVNCHQAIVVKPSDVDLCERCKGL